MSDKKDPLGDLFNPLHKIIENIADIWEAKKKSQDDPDSDPVIKYRASEHDARESIH